MNSWPSSAHEVVWEAGIACCQLKEDGLFRPPYYKAKKVVSSPEARLPFDGKGEKDVQFENFIKHQNRKMPEDIVCKKYWMLNLKAMLHHLYKRPTWYPWHAQHTAAEGLMYGAAWFRKENSDCWSMEWEEKEFQHKFCMAKPIKQIKGFTRVFQAALAVCSLPLHSRLQCFRDNFISAEKMLKESLTRAGLWAF